MKARPIHELPIHYLRSPMHHSMPPSGMEGGQGRCAGFDVWPSKAARGQLGLTAEPALFSLDSMVEASPSLWGGKENSPWHPAQAEAAASGQNILQCLLHMAEVEFALGTAKITPKTRISGTSRGTCSKHCNTKDDSLIIS